MIPIIKSIQTNWTQPEVEEEGVKLALAHSRTPATSLRRPASSTKTNRWELNYKETFKSPQLRWLFSPYSLRWLASVPPVTLVDGVVSARQDTRLVKIKKKRIPGETFVYLSLHSISIVINISIIIVMISGTLHYWLRPIERGKLVFRNFTSHFIRVQIFQIDFHLILYL